MTPCDAPLTELARALARGELSGLELVDAYLDRIDRHRFMGAFITVTTERARAEAAAADRKRARASPLALLGIPLAVKDVFSTRGVPTTAGSRILRNWIPQRDAMAIRRLRAAGAVLLGKLNMHEFANGVTNGNPHWGVCRNPWDPSRIPGGSSGGSAVAVRLGLCAASLGSDTGGSIRIPAALCGCVGLKPTYGAISVEGVIPLAWSLDHAGPITRTVTDAAALFNLLANRPAPRRSAEGLRVGLLHPKLTGPVAPSIGRATRAAIVGLRAHGASVRTVTVADMNLSVAAQLITLRAEAAAFHARWIRSRPHDYGADVRIRLQLGSLVGAADYVIAQRARDRLRAALRAVFEQVDVLALPTVPITAPRIGEMSVAWPSHTEPVDGALVRLTSPFNLTGVPALSVPCGLVDGLPVGLQLVAPWHEEGRLFAIGRAVERWTEAQGITLSPPGAGAPNR